jgi:hypothetical protein
VTESVEQAAPRRAAETDWPGRARREAAAVLDGCELVSPYHRDTLVSLLAVAWLQGVNYGSHDTLAHAEAAFDRLRESL